ncbi:PEP-CTERM sorting domain-containing protein [Rhodocyclaceae bacterium SMB388]
MFTYKSSFKPLAVAALFLCASASHAAFINTFTSLSAFNASTTLQGTDLYSGLPNFLRSPINRNTQSGEIYNYTASTPNTSFFGSSIGFVKGGSSENPFLTTNEATNTITINGFSPSINAIGGNFFGNNFSGLFAVGDIELTFADSLGASLTLTISAAELTSFRGVLSDGSITELAIRSVQPDSGFLWPSVDNLVLAQSSLNVPEPGSIALIGLGFAGLAAARRRKSV